MDVIHSAYRSAMLGFFADRPEIAVPGRWHFSPPGAECVPYEHRFSSSNWQERDERALGSWEIRQGYDKGFANPRYTGRRVCGDAAHWLDGGTWGERGTPATDVEGVPICCAAKPAPQGGIGCEGELTVLHGFFAPLTIGVRIGIALRSVPLTRLTVGILAGLRGFVGPIVVEPIGIRAGLTLTRGAVPPQVDHIGILAGLTLTRGAVPPQVDHIGILAGLGLSSSTIVPVRLPVGALSGQSLATSIPPGTQTLLVGAALGMTLRRGSHPPVSASIGLLAGAAVQLIPPSPAQLRAGNLVGAGLSSSLLVPVPLYVGVLAGMRVLASNPPLSQALSLGIALGMGHGESFIPTIALASGVLVGLGVSGSIPPVSQSLNIGVVVG